VAERSYETVGAWTLKLAEALGWPAGLAVTSFGADVPPIVVAGGMGGEVAWREWVASFGGEGDDDLTAVWGVLDRTMELITAGIDPGPPVTWDAQAVAAEHAEEAEEERLGVDRPRAR
jgi:hypothetical protein